MLLEIAAISFAGSTQSQERPKNLCFLYSSNKSGVSPSTPESKAPRKKLSNCRSFQLSIKKACKSRHDSRSSKAASRKLE
jgi:hypothetical protein